MFGRSVIQQRKGPFPRTEKCPVGSSKPCVDKQRDEQQEAEAAAPVEVAAGGAVEVERVAEVGVVRGGQPGPAQHAAHVSRGPARVPAICSVPARAQCQRAAVLGPGPHITEVTSRGLPQPEVILLCRNLTTSLCLLGTCVEHVSTVSMNCFYI